MRKARWIAGNLLSTAGFFVILSLVSYVLLGIAGHVPPPERAWWMMMGSAFAALVLGSIACYDEPPCNCIECASGL